MRRPWRWSRATTRTTAGRRSPCGTGSSCAGSSWRQKLGEPLPRPSVEADDETKVDPEVVRLKGALLAGVPDDPAERSEEDEAKALLADLLEWHRREAKPAWWRYFRLREMSSAELVDEPDAIGELVGGDVVGTVSRSIVRRFGFPPQEHGFGPGDKAQDPVSKQGLDRRRGRRGTRDHRPQDR